MLTPEEIKEAYRLFYMVKGHFNTTLDTVLSHKMDISNVYGMMVQTEHLYIIMKNSLKKPGQNMGKRY